MEVQFMINEHDVWRRRQEQWLQYIQGMTQALDAGRKIPLGPSTPPLIAPHSGAERTAKVVYCAAHPDDEALSGALALRLLLDSGAHVTNVAITLGSDPNQRSRRLRELDAACRALGFSLIVPQHPEGFENVSEDCRREKPEEWREKVALLREIFDREVPDAVFVPHEQDLNTTHVGTHQLVMDALEEHLKYQRRDSVLLVETEFWHQIERPNVMLGLSPEIVAAQLVGVCEHGDEMRRNPYHLLHICRLMDNVRRGSEVVGGQGAAAQPFVFAELYRASFVDGRTVHAPKGKGVIIDPKAKIDLAWLSSRLTG
jgi:N-acetylglucosamine malate deacetylase 1